VFLEKLIFAHLATHLKPSVELKFALPFFLISINSVVFFCVINKQKCAVQHTTLMSHHRLLHVSVHMNHHQALLYTTI
jgi:hypothetical protein